LFFYSFLANSGFAYETVFITGEKPIPINKSLGDRQKAAILSIPSASALEVSIYGDIDAKHDVLRVYNMKNGKTGDKIFEAKGKVEQLHPLIVEGNSIKVTLNSDKKTTRLGATVSIATLSPMTLMNTIKKEINSALQNIERRGASIAVEEINKSVNSFKSLQIKLKQNIQADKLNIAVGNTLTQLSYSYARIAELQEKLKSIHQKSLAVLKKSHTKTKNYVATTERRSQKEQQGLEQHKQKLLDENDILQRKKLEISIKAHQSLLKSLAVQHQVWLEFLHMQETLMLSLEKYLKHLDVLFHALNTNASIYRAAANVIQRDAQLVSETLSGLSNLQETIVAVSEDWAEISDLQRKIKEMGF